MKPDQEFDRLFRQEFQNILPNTIWQNDNGVYQVFGHYRIHPQRPGYRVLCAETDVGTFNTSRTALSWCIADKNRLYNVAREILYMDNKLASLTQDIDARARVGDRSNNPVFRETIGAKLETKIIHKKQLEIQLAKYVNWAKYFQQRGFDNEAQRTVRSQHNKTSR